MCRNIVPLNNLEPAATDEECQDAALQFVRKISGSNREQEAAKRRARSAERYEAIRVYQEEKRAARAS
ncbi:MAG: DUF2277 family protein [Microbacterium sp.]